MILKAACNMMMVVQHAGLRLLMATLLMTAWLACVGLGRTSHQKEREPLPCPYWIDANGGRMIATPLAIASSRDVSRRLAVPVARLGGVDQALALLDRVGQPGDGLSAGPEIILLRPEVAPRVTEIVGADLANLRSVLSSARDGAWDGRRVFVAVRGRDAVLDQAFLEACNDTRGSLALDLRDIDGLVISIESDIECASLDLALPLSARKAGNGVLVPGRVRLYSTSDDSVASLRLYAPGGINPLVVDTFVRTQIHLRDGVVTGKAPTTLGSELVRVAQNAGLSIAASMNSASELARYSLDLAMVEVNEIVDTLTIQGTDEIKGRMLNDFGSLNGNVRRISLDYMSTPSLPVSIGFLASMSGLEEVYISRCQADLATLAGASWHNSPGLRRWSWTTEFQSSDSVRRAALPPTLVEVDWLGCSLSDVDWLVEQCPGLKSLTLRLRSRGISDDDIDNSLLRTGVRASSLEKLTISGPLGENGFDLSWGRWIRSLAGGQLFSLCLNEVGKIDSRALQLATVGVRELEVYGNCELVWSDETVMPDTVRSLVVMPHRDGQSAAADLIGRLTRGAPRITEVVAGPLSPGLRFYNGMGDTVVVYEWP